MRRSLSFSLALVVGLALGGLAVTAGPSAAAAPTPTTAAGFFDMFQARNDWTWSGGDQATSLRAPNGLIYWIFGDTALGPEDPATGGYQSGWTIVSNTILIQRGGDLAAATAAPAVPDPVDGSRYWTQGMYVANGRLYVLCQRVRNLPPPRKGIELRGVELAQFAFNADGTLTFQGMLVPSPGGTTPGGLDYVTYSPQLHPEQPLASGRLLLSVSWNGTRDDLSDLAADADLYKPRFHEITISGRDLGQKGRQRRPFCPRSRRGEVRAADPARPPARH